MNRDTNADGYEVGQNKEDGSFVFRDSLAFGGQYDAAGTVEEEYVPEGFDSVTDYLTTARKEFEDSIDYDRENRDQALEDKKFTAGEQWEDHVLQQREGLPCLVINNIPQFTAQLVGDWRESRKAIKVVPHENGDTEVASVRGDLIRAIEEHSRASRVYDNAFESLIQCGDGAFRVAVEYARDDVFDQDIYIRPIEDALSVVWDSTSVDPTGRDARYCFVEDFVPTDELKRKWPDAYGNIQELGESALRSYRDNKWITKEGYRITEHWRMIEREKLLVLFENGSTRFVEDTSELEQMIEENGPILKHRYSPCSYAQMHLITCNQILAEPYEYKINRLPIVRMSGRTVSIEERRVRYGLVRFMKDPARLKNFWRSIAAEQLGYAPKAQWLAGASAVEGREEQFRTAHLKRDPLLIYNDDEGINPPQRLDPIAPEAALLNEAQVNAQDMKDVTGIHDASLGIKSNEVSGRAITARQREGDIAALTYYDNGNAAVLEAGDVINQLIPIVYDSTRIVRIIGEDQTEKFVKVNDPNNPDSPDLSIGKYDVALTTGSSYTTRRVEAAQAMMDAIQVWPQLLSVAGDLVAKAQDWPGADELAERLRKTIPPQFMSDKEKEQYGVQEQQATPEQIQEMQQALMELKTQNQELTLKSNSKDRENEIKAFEAETQRLKVMIDAENTVTAQEAKFLTDQMKIYTDDLKSQDQLNSKISNPVSPTNRQGDTGNNSPF